MSNESNSKLTASTIYKVGYENNILVSATIELLSKCNWRCKHCYLPAHDNEGLEKEEIFKLFCDLREMGTMNIILTGGEMFLRPDIFEIISKAREMYFSVTLLSNASLLDRKMIKKLANLHISQFSCTIFSLDETIHDNITQVKGSLKKSLENIILMKEMGIPIQVKTPILNDNRSSFMKVNEFCNENQISFGASPTIFSKSNGDSCTHCLRVNDEDLVTVLKDLDNIDESNDLRNLKTRKEDPSREACPALKYIISIDCKGNVYPCNSFYYKVGNIKEESISTIWTSKKLNDVTSIKNSEISVCSECEYIDYCYRCPGIAYIEDNDVYGCSSLAKQLAIARFKLYNKSEGRKQE